MLIRKARIVFYTVCDRATLFKSEQIEGEAAEEEGKRRGYQCCAFWCDKQHTNKSGKVLGSGFHVHGVNFH